MKRTQVTTAGILGTMALSMTTAAGIAAASPSTPAPPLTAVSGNGSNTSPFTAPCHTDPTQDDCTVTSFAPQSLGPSEDQFVPAYQCPVDHKYLTHDNYAPFLTSLINGVEIRGLSPIGVSMTSSREDEDIRRTSDGYDFAVGRTRTGFPYSSAQNWSFETHTYQVILHCTNNFDHAKIHHRNLGPLK